MSSSRMTGHLPCLPHLVAHRVGVGAAFSGAAFGWLLARATAGSRCGLRRCSLIERGQRAGSFTLHSVVLEYVTTRLATLDEAAFAEVNRRYLLLRDQLIRQVTNQRNTSRQAVRARAQEVGSLRKRSGTISRTTKHMACRVWPPKGAVMQARLTSSVSG
jgi:hypothetical protein